MSDKNLKGKSKYESPILVPLGEMAKGAGSCSTGSSGAPEVCNTGGTVTPSPPACTAGVTASTTCTAGGLATGACTMGTSATSACSAGNNTLPACTAGTIATGACTAGGVKA